MVAQPFHWEKAVAGVSIGKLAPEVTVFIQGVNNPDNFGSGVVIGRTGKNYLVLTAAHVVAAADRYTIQANDGVQYTLQNIRRLPNVDMAVVQFESSSSYTVAQMGNSDDVSLTTGVYVAGYPKPGQNIRVPVLTITNGEIAQVLPANASVDGYGFAYTNSTRAGMSGGPVFNSLGEVIAIHGRKEGEAGGGATNGAWLNLGIPINRYKGAGAGGTQIAAVSKVDLQQKAREAAQRQAQEQAQAQRQAQEQAQRAALESERQAKELAQKQAQERAAAARDAQQRQAQEQAQRQAAEAQRQAQAQQQAAAALAAQQRQTKEQAQQKAAAAALEAQRQAQQANIQAQQANAQRQAQIAASAKNLLASASPFAASALPPRTSTISSTREVCKDVRINTIVVKRCSTEVVNQIQESASAPLSNSSGTAVNNGNARAAGGNYQAAVDEYTAAIQANSGLAIAFFNRGLAHYNLGKKDRAIADFSKAADLFRSQGDFQKLQKTQDILQALTQSNS
jgi:tetratricopeptide (TPR) repeat protein